MSDRGEAFQFEQYRTLRKEIEDNTSEIRTLHRYAIAAIGAVWAWIATHHVQGWVAYIPVAFILLGTIHSILIVYDTQTLGAFIAHRIEPYFLHGAAPVGWEQWLESNGPEFIRRRKLLKDWRVWVNWSVMFAITLAVAILYQKGLLLPAK